MHLTRKNIGNFWPIRRKGTKYIAVSTHDQSESIPLLVVMRDILHLVQNKKELKKLIFEKQIVINHKEIRETNFPLLLFDILSLPLMEKNYKAVLNEHKKMIFKEVNEKETEKKIFKVIGKKILAGNKVQVNLLHGRNVFLNENVQVDDSVVYNLKKGAIEKVIKMEKGNHAYVLKGKHSGAEGKIEALIEHGGKKLVRIISSDKKINVWTKNVIVMEH